MVIMGGWILQNPCQNQVKTTLDFWFFSSVKWGTLKESCKTWKKFQRA